MIHVSENEGKFFEGEKMVTRFQRPPVASPSVREMLSLERVRKIDELLRVVTAPGLLVHKVRRGVEAHH